MIYSSLRAKSDIFLGSGTFCEFMNNWSMFLKNNKIVDWNDLNDETDEEDIPLENQWQTAKTKTKRSSIKNSRNISELVLGKIVYWNTLKNYGFIHCRKYPTNNVFFHKANFVNGTPNYGMFVECKIINENSKTFTERVTISTKTSPKRKHYKN